MSNPRYAEKFNTLAANGAAQKQLSVADVAKRLNSLCARIKR